MCESRLCKAYMMQHACLTTHVVHAHGEVPNVDCQLTWPMTWPSILIDICTQEVRGIVTGRSEVCPNEDACASIGKELKESNDEEHGGKSRRVPHAHAPEP